MEAQSSQLENKPTTPSNANNLSHADLRKAILGGARLEGADLSGALLAEADLSGTIDLIQDQLDQVISDKNTKFPERLKRPKAKK